MENDNKIAEPSVVASHNADLLETIKSLKQNSVSRDDYEALARENKELLNGFINGQKPSEDVPEVKVNIEDLRKGFLEGSNNLEVASNGLALRNAILEETGQDIMLPFGEGIIVSDSDRESANRVAEVLAECIEIADGDNAIFTNELQRRTKDVQVFRRK